MNKTLLLAVAVWIALGAFARADDSDDDPAALQLEEQVVRARTINESLSDPPVFIQIIEMDAFEGRFATTEEAVRQAAGVNVRDFGGLGKLSTISIRGSSADQVVVLLDGVRLSPATGGGVDFSTIPAEHIERIEVIRGGDSAFYGEGAVGGVVNIVTKKSKRKPTNTADVTYGSFGTYRAAATRSQGFDRGSYFVGGHILHTDGDFRFTNNNGTEFDDGDDYTDTRKNNESDSQGLLVKGTVRAGDRVDVAMQNEFFHAAKGIPGMVTFPSPNVHQQDYRDTASVSATVSDAGTPGLSFTTRAAYLFTSTEYKDNRGEQNAGVPLLTYQEEHAPELAETITYIWGTHQVLTLAAEYRRNMLLDGSFENPTRDTWGAALRDQVMFWDGRITIVPAVRYDDVSDQGSQWSPKLGLHFRPLDWLTIKGNAGRSFRAPNFNEMYYNHGFVEGNPDLKPERGTTYDAGLQFNTKWFSLEGAYFHSDLDDLIEYLLISGFRYKPFNISRAQIDGIELIASVFPIKYVEASGSYTITYAIDRTDEANRRGNQIPGRPRYKGFGRLALHYDPLTVFGEYHYIDGNFITRANTKLLDTRQILNLGVTVKPSPYISAGVEMKNALDDEVVDVRGFPLPGRSLFLTLSSSF